MRISPVYTPQNLVINPPHITNHPMLEVINTHMQEFEANKIGDKYIFNKTMQEEKLQNGFMLLGILIDLKERQYSKAFFSIFVTLLGILSDISSNFLNTIGNVNRC